MSKDALLPRLAEFSPTDVTPRLVDGLMTVVPGSPALPPYPGLPMVVKAMGHGPELVPAATLKMKEPGIQNILWMSRMVDAGDKTYAITTGLFSAVRFFFGAKENRSEALETDKQQRNDAVLKGFALAYMALKGFDGSVAERARAFAATPAGRALLTYYAAVEIALPFADNALSGGGEVVDGLWDKYGSTNLAKLSALGGGKDMDGVEGAMSALTGPIKGAVDTVWPHVDKIAGVAKAHVPGAMATGDKVAGALAGLADVLPVYRYLGGRLAAEAAVVKALQG